MIEVLAHVLAALLSGGTAAALTALSYLPPLWLRVLAPAALIAAAVWWVRYIDRPVRR